MDKDITINGITYENVKNIVFQSEDGENEVIFNDTTGATAEDDDVTAGETYYADGEQRTGTHECSPTSGDGTPGADGKSAYQIAVDNGFEGSEEEWIASLVGPKGEKGDTGADGKSAYQIAQENGYSGTEETFNMILGALGIDVGNIYIGNTTPNNTIHKLWVDNSNEDNILMKYKISTGEWIPISSGSGNGTGGSNVNGNISWENVDNKPFDSSMPFNNIDWNGEPTSVFTNTLSMDMDGTYIEARYYKLSDEYDIIKDDFKNCEVGLWQGDGVYDEIINDNENFEDSFIDFSSDVFSLQGMITIVKSDNISIDMSMLTGIEGSIVTFPEKGIYGFILYFPEENTPLQYISYIHPCEVVNKLDYRFIHKPNWYQNDYNGDGYIENRPFYGVRMDSIEWDGNEYEFPSTEFTFNGITSKCYKVIDGNEYKKYGFPSINNFVYNLCIRENINYIHITDVDNGSMGSSSNSSTISIESDYPIYTILWDNVPIIFFNVTDYSYSNSKYGATFDPGVYFAHTYIDNTRYYRAYNLSFNEIVFKKINPRYVDINIETTNYIDPNTPSSSAIPNVYAVVQYVKEYIGGAINGTY